MATNAIQVSLEDIIREVLENLQRIQRGEGNEELLKQQFKTEIKSEIISYLKDINQIIGQIELFIERVGILESTRELIGYGKQVKPKKILGNLKEIQDQLGVLLTLLDEVEGFSSDCISGLCQMLMQGVEIPKLEEFNTSEIRSISSFGILSEATTVVTLIVSFLGKNFAMKNLIAAFTQCFSWKKCTAVVIIAGAGGIFLKAGWNEISKCLENNEVFYQKLDILESQILECERKAKLTALLSTCEKEVNNRKNAELIIKIRNSFNQVLTSIKGAKSLNENKGKNDLEILEEMSGNPSYDGLVEPVMQELNCSRETAWEVIREILRRL